MRRFVRVLVLSLAGLLALACRAGGPAEPQVLRVAYMPILPSAQEFVKAEKGWFEEAGLRVEEKRFSSGPPIVQALAAGEVDVAYFGIGPALVAIDKGIAGKVVAANIQGPLAFVASEEFARFWEESPTREAFRRFREEKGRPLKVATFPEGSVPNLILRYWLERLGVSVGEEVEVVPMGEAQVRQAVLAGQVDATMIMEPIISIIRRAGAPYRPLVYSEEILPGQPGAVLFVRQEVLDRYPEAVERLVELHIRATRLLREDLEEAARILSRRIGPDVLPEDLAREALTSPAVNYVANPRAVVEGTQVLMGFMVQIGRLKGVHGLDEVFDFRFYDRVVRERPELRGY